MNDLGQRMKANYERRDRHYLTRRMPVIVRVDGRAFHTFTRGFPRPFDQTLIDSMASAAKELMGDMQGCKLAYVQSDEASFVLTDYDTLETQAWFDYNQSKVESISASHMTKAFNHRMCVADRSGSAMFDARAFNIPEDEVANYFLWRALDWQRNSLQMYARSHFSHAEMQGKGAAEIHEMLHTVGMSWVRLRDQLKNGTFLTRDTGEIAGFSLTVRPQWKYLEELWQSCLTFRENVV